MTSETNKNTSENHDDATSHDSHDSHGSHGREKPSYDDINTTAIVITGLISALFTFLAIAFVQGLYYQMNNGWVRARSTDYVNAPVKRIIDEQKKMLDGEAEGTVSIDEAMDKMMAKYGSEN